MTAASRYHRLGLSKNPFSGQILPSDNPLIPPYRPVKEKIDGFMNNFLENRASRGMVCIGDYGTGKTYHLKWMKNEFDKRQDVRTIYLETPGLEPYDLVRGILAEIGEEQIAKGVWNLVQPILIEDIKQGGQAEFLSQFAYEVEVKGKRSASRSYNPSQMSFGADYYGSLSENDLLDHRSFLKSFDKTRHLSREKLRDYFQQKLLQGRDPAVTKNVAVARELASICIYSGAPALDSWENLVIPGAGSPRAFPPQGEPVFLQSVVRILLKSGVKYLVLFIDEFEKVPLLETMTEREARRYLDTFRMLIDRNWHLLPFAWVLGSNEDAWAWIDKESRALPQRIVTKVTLPRTDDQAFAKYIVTEFLAQARSESFATVAENPLYPFPENLLDIIPLALRRTPRDLVKLCDMLIEAAADKQKTKMPITEKVIADVVESFSLDEAK
jgi:hypothetical protein